MGLDMELFALMLLIDVYYDLWQFIFDFAVEFEIILFDKQMSFLS